ncbi:MAG TPA: pantoate--beta-alanine ligase [Polyangiaceae bacterium]|nr:pantoate--beta-alanine ligase [Polyangiaceae bacterium]
MAFALHQEIATFRAACQQVRGRGERLGLVPTMGALHEGHLQLIDEASRHSDQVAVTIFVNPTQFGPNEDLNRYPRQLEQDLRLCEARGAALVFAPSASEMYLPGEQTRVSLGKLAEPLCGRSRPGHFTGVATVVTKLLAIAGPCVAVFGRKDYQQLKVIERLVQDLCLPVRVIGHSIVRESDGLAMSSRNAYLSSEDRKRALALARGLSFASMAYGLAGERNAAVLKQHVALSLAQEDAKVDYIELVDAQDLAEIPERVADEQTAVLAVAAYIGETRLIDNVELGVDPMPIDVSREVRGG